MIGQKYEQNVSFAISLRNQKPQLQSTNSFEFITQCNDDVGVLYDNTSDREAVILSPLSSSSDKPIEISDFEDLGVALALSFLGDYKDRYQMALQALKAVYEEEKYSFRQERVIEINSETLEFEINNSLDMSDFEYLPDDENEDVVCDYDYEEPEIDKIKLNHNSRCFAVRFGDIDEYLLIDESGDIVYHESGKLFEAALEDLRWHKNG
ncbi:hypothetical protein MA785_000815 [Vibrio parahaemolyticus]|nr:hypothetical protein [Vibrio parahaemolyticus]EJR2787924.1 hypothetical protein [Vibrio parahaemolyticus]